SANGIVDDDDDYEPKSYEELRQDAIHHYRQQKRYFEQAQTAYRHGMKAAASFYAQQGHLQNSQLKKANRLAAEKILEIRNGTLPKGVLDLHGLFVNEAISALSKFLSDFKNGKYFLSYLSLDFDFYAFVQRYPKGGNSDHWQGDSFGWWTEVKASCY
ncbi:unnamed protein product, partial [Soboliphyme baturini]|uniref:DUF1771 domain-containing protein n=1 Tax=Soboliphyme baturini TaxID=241478 RepID=A0A183J4S8_9BILA